MAESIEGYHRKFLDILAAHGRGGGQGLPEQRAPVGLAAAGHQAIRALVEEIHDQGYVLGQLHADGIFPEGQEDEVAAREDRLGIEKLKARARVRQAGKLHVDLVEGLCGNRADHEPHTVTEGSLAPFRCHADQSRRLPYAAEVRRRS